MVVTVTPATTLPLQQMMIMMIMMLRMVIRGIRCSQICFKKSQKPADMKPVQHLISFNEMCPTVMQFRIRCGTATAHIVCLSETLLCKLLWGCSLDMAYYCSEMCHECQRAATLYEI